MEDQFLYLSFLSKFNITDLFHMGFAKEQCFIEMAVMHGYNVYIYMYTYQPRPLKNLLQSIKGISRRSVKLPLTLFMECSANQSVTRIQGHNLSSNELTHVLLNLEKRNK